MNANDYLSEDGLVLLLLCSMLGLDEKTSPGFASPLTLSEWNKLAPALSASPLKSPGGLLGQSAAELAKALVVAPEQAERLVKLLERSSRLTLELESLFS